MEMKLGIYNRLSDKKQYSETLCWNNVQKSRPETRSWNTARKPHSETMLEDHILKQCPKIVS